MSDLEERELGSTTVLFGESGGKYPDGNSLLVRGSRETALIDPALGIWPRRDSLPPVDRILLSHCHEDHIAGNPVFPAAAVHLHELDRPGIQSLDAMMDIYGFAEPIQTPWRKAVAERFHFQPRPDAQSFHDGDVFDLGGVRLRVIHAPGHTRGHSLFHVEPDDVLYLGDIDLSSFGPYYGDAWSSLEDFVTTLRAVRAIEVSYYATFHHIGVLERDAFLARLDRFEAVIGDREQRLLAFLAEPHTLEEVAEHRFVYRPGDAVPSATPVETRSMQQHIEALLAEGRLREVESGRYLAT